MPKSLTSLLLAVTLCSCAAASPSPDWRNIRTGLVIPDEGYCDQPYVVVRKDGAWLCVLTTGPGREGQRGQHVVAAISADKGRSWTPLVDIEPSNGPEASWVVPLITPAGRIYAFYTYNGDRIERLPGSRRRIRADTLGWFCYKYSDDGGRSWSKRRFRLPMRLTACDRGNDWHGKVQIFWSIDKPKAAGRHVRFAFTKLGRYMLEEGEGWLFDSDNLLTERDVGKLRWQMLPVGEHGIRAPEFGSVQEEHNHVPIDEQRLYLVYRTTTGYPCHCYSSDGGRTWTRPVQMTYTPGGRRIKNPRACPKLWKCSNGKYLFWFHNHSGHSFQGRNPAWLSGGELRDGKLYWSQPEILLYDPDPNVRMCYPDLIEQDGHYWVTETQKSIARVHAIDRTLLEGLWNQGKLRTVARGGLLLEHSGGGQATLSKPLNLAETSGLTIDMWLAFNRLSGPQTLLDGRDGAGRGILVTLSAEGAVRIELNDGHSKAAWDSDPGVTGPGRQHHVVAIVDAGPRIIMFVVDGQLCDGGERRQYGWGRYAKPLGDVTGSGTLRISPQIKHLRVYARYLRVSEAISNYHAGVE